MEFEKSMKVANKQRTLCEVVREVNDYLKEHPDSLILEKLKEIHSMAKRMTKKLYEYNKEYDKGWWEKNPDYEKDLLRRLK